MIIKTKRHIYKLITLVTLLMFLVGDIAWAMPDGGLAIRPQMETPSFLQVEIPSDLASVEEIYEAPANENPKLILNIQNIHGNYESQVQISKLLQYLYEKFGFKLLFAEGSAEKLNMDLLRFFPDAERNRKLADLMAKNGELTGIEYFMMDGPKDVEAVGIEKAELYRQNYDAFKKVYSAQAETEEFLELFEGRLETLSSRIFSPNTRRILSEWRKFESGHRDFLPYVQRLAGDAKTVLNLDLESLFAQVEWPQITRLLALQSMEKDLDRKAAETDRTRLLAFLNEQKISPKIIHAIETLDEKKISMSRTEEETRREDLPRYLFERLVDEAAPKGFKFHDYPAFSLWAGHLILQNELDSKLLFEEIEKVFTRILTELTVSEREKNLMELTRDEILLRKLLHLEVTRGEWERAVYRKDWMMLSAMVGRLKKISDDISGDMKLNMEDWKRLEKMAGQAGSSKKGTLNAILETSYEFYDFARKREEVFFNTIENTMNQKGVEKAVLVTGGFHTDGLMDMFRENEFNASILMPRINGDLDNSAYVSTMMENKPAMFDIATMEIPGPAQTKDTLKAEGVNYPYFIGTLIQRVMEAGQLSREEASALVGEKQGVMVGAQEVAGKKPVLSIITPAPKGPAKRSSERAAPVLRAENRVAPKAPEFDGELDVDGKFPRSFQVRVFSEFDDEDEKPRTLSVVVSLPKKQKTPQFGAANNNISSVEYDVSSATSDAVYGSVIVSFNQDGSINTVNFPGLTLSKPVYKSNLEAWFKSIEESGRPFNADHPSFKPKTAFDPDDDPLAFALPAGVEVYPILVTSNVADPSRFTYRIRIDGNVPDISLEQALGSVQALRGGERLLPVAVLGAPLEGLPEIPRIRNGDPVTFVVRSENRQGPKNIQAVARITVEGEEREIYIREGGILSVDIGMAPVPTKTDAVSDAISTTRIGKVVEQAIQEAGITPDQAIYIGNQNKDLKDRDGQVAKIAGIRVKAVDEKQEEVFASGLPSNVEKLGTETVKGIEATQAYLQKLLDMNEAEFAAENIRFIGLDIDDTILGNKNIGTPEKPKIVKESFADGDRLAIADLIIKLEAKHGVRFGFFSDNDSRLTQKRVGDYLKSRHQSDNVDISQEVVFYTSGMVTKNVLKPKDGVWGVETDAEYSNKYRMPASFLKAVQDELGSVAENPQTGVVEAVGPLGEEGLVWKYYSQYLTVADANGKRIFSPEVTAQYGKFQPGTTPLGNIPLPSVQVRDDAEDGSAAQAALLPVIGRSMNLESQPEILGEDIRSRLVFELLDRLVKKYGGEIVEQNREQIVAEARPEKRELLPSAKSAVLAPAPAEPLTIAAFRRNENQKVSLRITIGDITINIHEEATLVSGRPVLDRNVLNGTLKNIAPRLTDADRNALDSYPTEGLNADVLKKFDVIREALVGPAQKILIPGQPQTESRDVTPLTSLPEVTTPLGVGIFKLLIDDGAPLADVVPPSLRVAVLAGGLVEQSSQLPALAQALAAGTQSRSEQDSNFDSLKGTILEANTQEAKAMLVLDVKFDDAMLNETAESIALMLVPFTKTNLVVVFVDSGMKAGERAVTSEANQRIAKILGAEGSKRFEVRRIPKSTAKAGVAKVKAGMRVTDTEYYSEAYVATDPKTLRDYSDSTAVSNPIGLLIDQNEVPKTVLKMLTSMGIVTISEAAKILNIPDLYQGRKYGVNLVNNNTLLNNVFKVLSTALTALRRVITAA